MSMSDILIKGMEMPTNCEKCQTVLECCDELEDGTVWCRLAHGYIGDERTVCPLVPTADMRPVVRGEWIIHPRETWIGVDINGNETQPRQFFAYECPFCGFTTGMSGKNYNFCPNCGAQMEES